MNNWWCNLMIIYFKSQVGRPTISPTTSVMPFWISTVDPGASPPRTNVQRQSAKYIGLIGNWPFPSNIARPLNVAVAGAEAAGSGNLIYDFQVASWWKVAQGMVTPLVNRDLDKKHLFESLTCWWPSLDVTREVPSSHRRQEVTLATAKSNMKVWRKSIKCPVVLLKQ